MTAAWSFINFDLVWSGLLIGNCDERRRLGVFVLFFGLD